MVRLYRIDLPGCRGACTVWAESPDDALAQDLAGARHGAQAVDITAQHTDRDNPYRALALAVITRGTRGRAHLRLTSQRATTGWCFSDGAVVAEDDPDAAPSLILAVFRPTALCA